MYIFVLYTHQDRGEGDPLARVAACMTNSLPARRKEMIKLLANALSFIVSALAGCCTTKVVGTPLLTEY